MGKDHIQEVVCTGEWLSSEVNPILMVLFSWRQNQVIASVNLASKECLTARSFSSCRIDEANSRRTRLAALVVDLEYGEERVYGCNVSVVESGTRMVSFSWRVTVKRVSKCS
ncbi:hypothetical protein BaRGS_00018489 [Batillaria attramentaria]|uniref:Uncharacterized protein n=1 Tax=Batillaria attramentaria TaxID=370345 RepID=A0ABD0KSV5_9CAEN